MVKIRSPPGVKTTSTGLSMPPVITGSMPDAVGPAAEDVRGLGDERRLAGPLVGLLGERPLAPVDPAVGAEVGAVQVVGAAGERLALEPLDALVGHAVAVGVGQLPDARRRRRRRASRRSHIVPSGNIIWSAKTVLLVEPAVAVGVLEPDDPVRLLRELLLRPCRSSPTSRRRRAGPARRSRR